LFPHESSSREHGVEEERRLMYVAITRARQRLYLSFAQTRMLHGQTRYNMKSRFFDELPEDALKWLTPKVQPSWFGGKKSAWDEVPMVGSDKALAQKIASKALEAGSGWRMGNRWPTPSSARASS
jgi:DNA helicase-2/ATP-dependent DNA helicase PcrA